ncbi:MAG: hypothetical protein M3P97_08950 [Actinomycetota bacterium]|nr:hypothetical protein [Actinomycetota bacterium]
MALALIAAACGGDDDADLVPAATVGTAPTTTSTTARPIDVAVIPDDPAQIDEDYVQAVVDALFAVDAEATKIFVETKTLDERGIDYLEAIYTEDEVERQVNIWFQSLAQRADELLGGTLLNDVQRVIDVADDCIYIEVESDYSEVTTRDAPLTSNYLGLTPKDEDDDPEGRNPTAWMMFMDAVNLDGSEPENPCEGR